MFKSKDIGGQNGLKNKIHLYIAYKRLTLDKRRTKTDSEGMEKHTP